MGLDRVGWNGEFFFLDDLRNSGKRGEWKGGRGWWWWVGGQQRDSEDVMGAGFDMMGYLSNRRGRNAEDNQLNV